MTELPTSSGILLKWLTLKKIPFRGESYGAMGSEFMMQWSRKTQYFDSLVSIIRLSAKYIASPMLCLYK